jgi:hypothetical protein
MDPTPRRLVVNHPSLLDQPEAGYRIHRFDFLWLFRCNYCGHSQVEINGASERNSVPSQRCTWRPAWGPLAPLWPPTRGWDIKCKLAHTSTGAPRLLRTFLRCCGRLPPCSSSVPALTRSLSTSIGGRYPLPSQSRPQSPISLSVRTVYVLALTTAEADGSPIVTVADPSNSPAYSRDQFKTWDTSEHPKP